jgi:hypothetical protein
VKPVLETGCKAFYDAYLFGLIPCKVLSVESSDKIRVQLTASRGQYDTYKRGEIIETNHQSAIPRSAAHLRSGKYRIRSYETKLDGVSK